MYENLSLKSYIFTQFGPKKKGESIYLLLLYIYLNILFLLAGVNSENLKELNAPEVLKYLKEKKLAASLLTNGHFV